MTTKKGQEALEELELVLESRDLFNELNEFNLRYKSNINQNCFVLSTPDNYLSFSDFEYKIPRNDMYEKLLLNAMDEYIEKQIGSLKNHKYFFYINGNIIFKYNENFD